MGIVAKSWKKLGKVGKSGEKLGKSGKKWRKVAKSGQKWGKVGKSGQKWAKVAKVAKVAICGFNYLYIKCILYILHITDCIANLAISL